MRRSLTAVVVFVLVRFANGAETTNSATPSAVEESLNFVQQRLSKTIADATWFSRLQGVAVVDKVHFVGPAPQNLVQRQITTNGVIIPAYTFLPVPKHRGKLPLIVLLHTEVHGDFNPDDDFRVTRELVEQGYAVIAPDYRGSTGYGGDFWRLIDYGGLEVDDVWLARQWMLEHHRDIDPARVGIMGWSHGGLIALMNVFEHPTDYAVCYAGMPVTDLPFRLKQKGKDYTQLFSAPYHIGKTVEQDKAEYYRRSPVAHAAKLICPLLLHSASNDQDVSQAEVEQLVEALKFAGKTFEYKVYTNAPSGHAFNKLDTVEAERSRREIYQFLARFLKPLWPPRAE